jgi:uncharacterized membrane protein
MNLYAGLFLAIVVVILIGIGLYIDEYVRDGKVP